MALAGAVHGFAPLGVATLVASAAVLVQLVLCVVGSRAVTTALSAVLRSRWGRDVLVVLGALLGGGAAIAWNAVVHLVDDVHPDRLAARLERVADVLGWLPPGLAARAVADAGAGELAAAASELPLAAAAAAVLAWMWAAALARSLTGASGSAPRRAPLPSATCSRGSRGVGLSRVGVLVADESLAGGAPELVERLAAWRS